MGVSRHESSGYRYHTGDHQQEFLGYGNHQESSSPRFPIAGNTQVNQRSHGNSPVNHPGGAYGYNVAHKSREKRQPRPRSSHENIGRDGGSGKHLSARAPGKRHAPREGSGDEGISSTKMSKSDSCPIRGCRGEFTLRHSLRSHLPEVMDLRVPIHDNFTRRRLGFPLTMGVRVIREGTTLVDVMRFCSSMGYTLNGASGNPSTWTLTSGTV
ncbi:hypothetical protein DPMN_112981 [Dreissena polymorpha]|uniref:Uncharacterized protein n=1 Tax=Dreissena polymorpha TaxID=45954 RepID=A0A9D4QQE0_DREPO|nr:hypothetical protein DPMN_112981 [Dreissena polymorpha]